MYRPYKKDMSCPSNQEPFSMAHTPVLTSQIVGPTAALCAKYLADGYSRSHAHTKARCELDPAYKELQAAKTKAKVSAWNKQHRTKINERMKNRYREDDNYRAHLLQRQANLYHSEPYHSKRLAQMKARLETAAGAAATAASSPARGAPTI